MIEDNTKVSGVKCLQSLLETYNCVPDFAGQPAMADLLRDQFELDSIGQRVLLCSIAATTGATMTLIQSGNSIAASRGARVASTAQP